MLYLPKLKTETKNPTLTPKPYTSDLNPQPYPPLNTKLQILNPKPLDTNLKHQTPNYQHNPSTQYPKFETVTHIYLIFHLYHYYLHQIDFANFISANFNPIT